MKNQLHYQHISGLADVCIPLYVDDAFFYTHLLTDTFVQWDYCPPTGCHFHISNVYFYFCFLVIMVCADAFLGHTCERGLDLNWLFITRVLIKLKMLNRPMKTAELHFNFVRFSINYNCYVPRIKICFRKLFVSGWCAHLRNQVISDALLFFSCMPDMPNKKVENVLSTHIFFTPQKPYTALWEALQVTSFLDSPSIADSSYF